jgi:hypothetical protein
LEKGMHRNYPALRRLITNSAEIVRNSSLGSVRKRD